MNNRTILPAALRISETKLPRNSWMQAQMTLRVLIATVLFSSGWLSAAELPEHSPLSMLIFADEVNPHKLADGDITQPEDLAPALTASDSPLRTSTVTTVDSQCADEALADLASSEPPDVVLYFAHRAAKHCDGSDAEPEFTRLIEQGLQRGLGVVVLHHGLYVDIFQPGAKDALLQLLGARSNSIKWDTTNGQRVFNVGGSHFVSSNGLAYTQQAAFAGIEGVVPAGTYPYFVNVPDELYADTTLVAAADEIRIPLFASDSSGERLLGYTLSRPGWQGRVVAWQPAEYQPNALDDRNGPNFQILVNAIYFAAYGEPGSKQ